MLCRSSVVLAAVFVTAILPAQSDPLVAVSGSHTLIADVNGKLWGFGTNLEGQLGVGARQRVQAWPVPVQFTGSIRTIGAGPNFSFIVDDQGQLWAFGDNTQSRLGLGDDLDRLVPTRVAGISRVTAVSGDGSHALAIDETGQLWAWGRQFEGQLGLGQGGSLVSQSTPAPVPGMTSVALIDAGFQHSLVVDTSGNLWAFGNNFRGQLGLGDRQNRDVPVRVPGITGVTAIAASNGNSLVVDGTGQLWSFGENLRGELGLGDQIDRDVPVAVPGMTDVVSVQAGFKFSIVLDRNGGVWGFGANNVGQLGLGDAVDRLVPTRQTALTTATWIRAGDSNHVVLGDAIGRPHAQGYNRQGQLGIGGQTTSLEPAPIIPNTRLTRTDNCRASNGNLIRFVELIPPAVGNGVGMQLQDLPTASTFAVPVLSLRGYISTSLRSIGAPDCTFNIRPDVVLDPVMLPGSGNGFWGMALPDLPELAGQALHLQFLVEDSAANQAGFVPSLPGMLWFGPRYY